MANWQWIRANWRDCIGVPGPDAKPWMLRDTPIDLGTLRTLSNHNTRTVEGWVRKADERPKHVPATPTRAETVQYRYETVSDYSPRYGSLPDAVATAAPDAISRDVVQAFAADPDADLYVVEVFPAESVANDIRAVEQQYGIDARLTGVGIEEPAGYPGRFVEFDAELLRDTRSPVWRALPGGDLLIMSPGNEYAHISPVAESTDAQVTVLDPVAGAVRAVIRDEFIRDEQLAVGDTQTVLDRFGTAPNADRVAVREESDLTGRDAV